MAHHMFCGADAKKKKIIIEDYNTGLTLYTTHSVI